MNGEHFYELAVTWTGNTGTGTSDYRAYARSHSVFVNKKVEICCSSDPAFMGDNQKHNPEELFVASIASCHMLWYLHLCAEAGVIVQGYTDNATGTMKETETGGNFVGVTLSPVVLVSEKWMIEKANELHHKANQFCFIANSCNFPITHNPICKVF